MPSTLTVSDRHSRAIQSFVRRPLGLQLSDQMHHESFDELCVGTHEAVELGAIWQGGKSIAQRAPCVAVEVPLARETAPPSEDGQGDHLACTQGCLPAWLLLRCWQMGVAEVVDHNVKCSEEGVLRSTMRRVGSLSVKAPRVKRRCSISTDSSGMSRVERVRWQTLFPRRRRSVVFRAHPAPNRRPALSRCSVYALWRAGDMMIDGVISP
jgi:hypothetical protein